MLSAASLQAFSDRDVNNTFAPAATKFFAIINPIPRDPPVINTFFPETENRDVITLLDADADADPADIAVAVTIIVDYQSTNKPINQSTNKPIN